jgi:hypothetical protein
MPAGCGESVIRQQKCCKRQTDPVSERKCDGIVIELASLGKQPDPAKPEK